MCQSESIHAVTTKHPLLCVIDEQSSHRLKQRCSRIAPNTSITVMNGLYVVAGASGAIGKRLAHTILQQGGTPLLVGRSADKLAAVNDELLGGKGMVLADIDFSKPTEAGKKMASDLKGESLRGLACE